MRLPRKLSSMNLDSKPRGILSRRTQYMKWQSDAQTVRCRTMTTCDAGTGPAVSACTSSQLADLIWNQVHADVAGDAFQTDLGSGCDDADAPDQMLFS